MIHSKKAFTLIELLVVISIIALLIGILLPALGAARRSAQQIKNSANIRSVSQAFFIHSQGNNGWYAGIESSGLVPGNAPATFVDNDMIENFETPFDTIAGSTVQGRFMILLNGSYMAGDALFCPGEINEDLEIWEPNVIYGQDQSSDRPGKFNSYATAQLAQSVSTDNGALDGLAGEWRDSASSKAITVSDRLYGGLGVDSKIPSTHRSVWSKGEPRWIGSIAFNDNHVELHRTSLLEAGKLSFGNYTSKYDDNIFHRGAPGNDWNAVEKVWNKNANMVINGPWGPVWEWKVD
ncbi:prepilin-type N-terminal cleavage/methylation domain-containing protein [Planctomycetota bacterium]|nr:prepilin-type N-terminal cleavage/methylation domain-containing protein [Planctomycetota bacterium]